MGRPLTWVEAKSIVRCDCVRPDAGRCAAVRGIDVIFCACQCHDRWQAVKEPRPLPEVKQ